MPLDRSAIDSIDQLSEAVSESSYEVSFKTEPTFNELSENLELPKKFKDPTKLNSESVRN